MANKFPPTHITVRPSVIHYSLRAFCSVAGVDALRTECVTRFRRTNHQPAPPARIDTVAEPLFPKLLFIHKSTLPATRCSSSNSNAHANWVRSNETTTTPLCLPYSCMPVADELLILPPFCLFAHGGVLCLWGCVRRVMFTCHYKFTSCQHRINILQKRLLLCVLFPFSHLYVSLGRVWLASSL